MTAFNFIDGKPIDLNNQKHRDIIIQRNKTLEKALSEGVELCDNKLFVDIEIQVRFECLKCGSAISSQKNEYGINGELNNFFEYNISSNLPILKCSYCKTRYSFDPKSEVFHLALPKQNQLQNLLKNDTNPIWK